LIFLHNKSEPFSGLIERVSIAIKDHPPKIIDLKCVLVLDPLSFSLEPLVVDLNYLAFPVMVEVNIKLADAFEWSADSAGDTISKIVVGHVDELWRQVKIFNLRVMSNGFGGFAFRFDCICCTLAGSRAESPTSGFGAVSLVSAPAADAIRSLAPPVRIMALGFSTDVDPASIFFETGE
jgi:hypothetical protein